MYNEKTYNLEITDEEQPYISGPDESNAGQNLKFDAIVQTFRTGTLHDITGILEMKPLRQVRKLIKYI